MDTKNDISTITSYIKSTNPLKLRSNNLKILDLPVWKDILKNTSNKYSDKARIYLFIMNKFSIECSNDECSNVTKFDNDKNIFRKFCSVKCRNKDIKLRNQISKSWTKTKKQEKNKKSIETCEKKYGQSNPMKVKEIQDKAKDTCMQKYGANSNTYKHFTNIKDYNKQYIVNHFIKNGILDINKMVEHFNISRSNINKRMEYLNINYSRGLSSPEQEVAEFIKSLNVDIKQSDRTLISPLELDIIIPDYNIAIEFNGLYWHSYGKNNVNDKQKDLHYNKNRHLEKTELCELENYQLFHIFENEWENKKDIWKSKIRYALDKSERIGARKCYIKEIDNKQADNFLETNHLQGNCQSTVQLGLFYKTTNDLVSIMTFGKNYDKNYELIRFCSRLNLQVVGAASKLLKYFEKIYKPHNIISYANRRWSTGNLYKTLKFKQTAKIKPNSFYFKNDNILYPPIKFQKHNFKKIIEDGYRSIFDSGNLSFVKNFKNDL